MLERRVLVTGATGLIGRHVVRALLEKGADVHATTRSLAHETSGDVRWHKANLLDTRERLQVLDAAAPQTIIHCAWVTEHGVYWTSPENLDWVAASLMLAREGRERGVTRFVGLGTCAEYAWHDGEILSEVATALRPSTLYGAAKDSARRVLQAFAAAGGPSLAWARIAFLYGAGEHKDRFVAALCRALIKGEAARMSSGTAVRDFLDARDVGGAVAAIALSQATGAINVGSGSPVSLLHVGQTLARLAGAPHLLQPGAIPDRPNEPAKLAMDVTRLVREIGFVPQISLERGLEDALNNWRAREAA